MILNNLYRHTPSDVKYTKFSKSKSQSSDGNVLPPVGGPLHVVQADGPAPGENLSENRLLPPRTSYYRTIAAARPRTNDLGALHVEPSAA